jgi:hypothetical protein
MGTGVLIPILLGAVVAGVGLTLRRVLGVTWSAERTASVLAGVIRGGV